MAGQEQEAAVLLEQSQPAGGVGQPRLEVGNDLFLILNQLCWEAMRFSLSSRVSSRRLR